MPVSSRTSRCAAAAAVSPGSTWPLGSARTFLPPAARRTGTIAATAPSRTRTPPALTSAGLRAASVDVALEGRGVVDGQAPPSLADDPGALEHREEAAPGLARRGR